MNLASLEKVTRRHAAKLVLDEVTFGIDAGERVGVIGRNGSGKSTLLRIIAGVDEPDAGRAVRGRDVRVHYLAQNPVLASDRGALGAVLAADTPAARTARAFQRASADVRARPTDPAAQRALESMTAAMDAVGAWEVEHRARALLGKLGITDLDRPVAQLSGGQRKRVALARALFEDVDLLILDEPTNHLDVDVIEWLEDALGARHGALVLVTHDRYLLDRVVTRIVEVHRGSLHQHAGGYADYLEARQLRADQSAAAERRRRNRARTELEWLRRGPKARTSKAKFRVGQARDLLAEGPQPVDEDLSISLPARRLGGKVVNLHNAGVSLGGRRVLRGVDHKLAPDDRVGVVGPNGSGKTTLLRLIAGHLEPDEGSVRRGTTVHVGYYGQEPEALPPGQRVLDAVREVVLETNTVEGITLSAPELLERFLFPPDAQKALVGELSGGERRRLQLLRVLADAPNLLLLDEPTNDLDLDTLAVLEEYLTSWTGALVVASHDRFFLDRVCHQLFSLERDGSLRHHPGGWTAYRERQRDLERQRPPRESPDRPAPARTPQRPRKLSYNERRELRLLERRLPQLADRRDELTAAVQQAGDDYAAAGAAGAELTALLEELERTETRWLELATIEEDA